MLVVNFDFMSVLVLVYLLFVIELVLVLVSEWNVFLNCLMILVCLSLVWLCSGLMCLVVEVVFLLLSFFCLMCSILVII